MGLRCTNIFQYEIFLFEIIENEIKANYGSTCKYYTGFDWMKYGELMWEQQMLHHFSLSS